MQRKSGNTRGLVRCALALVAAALAVALIAACGGSKENSSGKATASSGGSGGGSTITFAVLTSKSGPCQAFDESGALGDELAIDKLNEKPVSIGGKSYKFQAKVINTKGENTVGVSEVTGALHEGVKFFLGPICSASAMPGVGALLAKDKEVIAINNYGGAGLNANSEAETIANVKGEWKNIFSNTIGTEEEGIRDSYDLESFPNWKQTIKKAYILMQNEAGAEIIGKGFAKGLQKQGIESESAFYSPSTTDFSGFLAKVKAYKPDVLVSGYLPVPSLAVLKQMLADNAAPRYFGYGEPVEDALKTAVGGPIPVPAVWDFNPVSLKYDKRETVQSLRKAIEAKTGQLSPNAGYTGTEYDTPFMLAEAMQAAGTTEDVNKIGRALEKVTHSGIYENAHFSATHHLPSAGTDSCLIEKGMISNCYNNTVNGQGAKVGP